MPHYRWLGEQIELSERDFLVRLVRSASHQLLVWAQSLYLGHVAGFPDINGKRIVNHTRTGIEIMDEAQRQLADGRLRQMCVSLRDKVTEMILLDAEAVGFVAGYLGRQPLDRRKLSRYIESKNFTSDYPSGAVWIVEPRYRVLRRRSLALFDAAWLLDHQIAVRIKELVEAQGGTYEDITAHDTAPILRPVEQLRGSIEAMRQQLRDFGALSERYTEIAVASLTDLPTDTDKDTNSS